MKLPCTQKPPGFSVCAQSYLDLKTHQRVTWSASCLVPSFPSLAPEGAKLRHLHSSHSLRPDPNHQLQPWKVNTLTTSLLPIHLKVVWNCIGKRSSIFSGHKCYELYEFLWIIWIFLDYTDISFFIERFLRTFCFLSNSN